MDVIGYRQIELAIPVVIDKGAARSPQLARARDPGRSGHLGEGAIALIVIKPVFAICGNKKILVTVIVIIADTRTLAPSCFGKAGMRGHIRERAIVVVMKQMAGGVLRFLILRRQQVSIHQKDVGPAVVVVVEDRDAAPRSFKNVDVYKRQDRGRLRAKAESRRGCRLFVVG